MSFSTLPPEVRAIAEDLLTAKQLEAFRLELAGIGLMRAARMLGISKQSVVARLDGAHRKLMAAGVRQDALGNWYREEAA